MSRKNAERFRHDDMQKNKNLKRAQRIWKIAARFKRSGPHLSCEKAFSPGGKTEIRRAFRENRATPLMPGPVHNKWDGKERPIHAPDD
ncbi:MAG: hypothetical protein ABW055_04630 [Pararhizobium sp.]